MNKLHLCYLIIIVFTNIIFYNISYKDCEDDYTGGKKMIFTVEEYMPGILCPLYFCTKQAQETEKLLKFFKGNVIIENKNVTIQLPDIGGESQNIAHITFTFPEENSDDSNNLRQKITNKIMRFNLILFYLKQCKENFLSYIKEPELGKKFNEYYDKIVYNIFKNNGKMYSILKNEFDVTNDEKHNKNQDLPTIIQAENIIRNEIDNNKILIRLFEYCIRINKNENIYKILDDINKSNNNNKNNENNDQTYDILTGIVKSNSNI